MINDQVLFSWELKCICNFSHLQIINNLLIYQAVGAAIKETIQTSNFTQCSSTWLIWHWFAYSFCLAHLQMNGQQNIPNTLKVFWISMRFELVSTNRIDALHWNCVQFLAIYERLIRMCKILICHARASHQINNRAHSFSPSPIAIGQCNRNNESALGISIRSLHTSRAHCDYFQRTVNPFQMHIMAILMAHQAIV